MASPAAAKCLPASLRPMLATAADGPLDSPGYAYELKWDGMRVLAGLSGDELCLRTRTGIEAFTRFPELEALRRAVRPSRAILDGEIVRLVEGRPSFFALQRRIQASRTDDIARLAESEPVALLLFDLLHVDDCSILDQPWEARRRELEEVVAPSGPIQLSPVWDDGRSLWSVVLEQNLEGAMAKLRSGRYRPGQRTREWLKIKVTDTVDVFVGGWTEGTGARTGTVGALLLGEMIPEGLNYVGHVGTGFDSAGLDEALRLLAPLEVPRSPFLSVPAANAPVHWVRPEYSCEVRHQGRSPEGRLRVPVFVRWR